MRCLSCGGPLEFAGNGAHARCTHCLALFSASNGQLTPIVVQAPGGGNNPAFNAVYAQQLGFAPRQASHQTFQVGGVGVKVDTDEMKSRFKLWVIMACVVLVLGGGFGIFMYLKIKKETDAAMGAANDGLRQMNSAMSDLGNPGAAKAKSWDGKAPLQCGGNDQVKVEGVTASFTSGTAITAGGNCHLDLVNVTLTAPNAIEAGGNAHVTITGGTIKGSDTAVNAGGNAEVVVGGGAKIDGKKTKGGNAKITGG